MKRYSPQEKKTLSYKKDHYTRPEYPHSGRKTWPRKKARVKRIYRRKVNSVLTQIDNEESSEDLETKIKTIYRKRIYKIGVVSLKTWVLTRANGKSSSLGYNYFKTPYNSKLHRERFISFLQSITNAKHEEAKPLAKAVSMWFIDPHTIVFNKWLYSEELQGWRGNLAPTSYDWLKDFFKEEPCWENRLRNWLRKFGY